MATFKLVCRVTVSAYTEVKAGTLAEAIALAEKRSVVIGGPGNGNNADESWIIDEADGSPTGIEVD